MDIELAETLRAEMHRQKILFESELKRQRDHFEAALGENAKAMKEREAECRALQSAVTALGRKFEALAEHHPQTPPKTVSRQSSPVVRRPSPTPSTGSRGTSPNPRATPVLRKPSPTPVRPLGVPANIKAALNTSSSTQPRIPPFLLTQLAPPTGAPLIKTSGAELPPTKLELSRIYGVGSVANTQTPPVILTVGLNGEACMYTAGSICVVIHPTQTQYYYGHTEAVTAACVHPGDAKFRPGSLVATAQMGRKPHICIWDIETATTVATLRDFHEKTVLAVSFAPSGEYLATICGDTQHTLFVFFWQSKELLVSTKVSTEQFSAMQYHPYDPRILVTLCSHNLKLWEMQFTGKGHGMKLIPKTGLIPPATGTKGAKCAGFKAIAFLDAKVTLVGSLEGSLYLWKGTELALTIGDVHPGGVTAASDVPSTDVALTSGCDGNVHVWRRSALLSDSGAAFSPIRTVHVKEFAASVKPFTLGALLNFSVGSATHAGGGSLGVYAISSGNFVLQIGISAEPGTSAGTCKALTATHGRAPIAPLVCCHPVTNKAFVATQSTLQIVDLSTGVFSCAALLVAVPTALTANADGTTLALARAPKTIAFHDATTLLETSTLTDAIPDIGLLKFSPDGRYLAAASSKEPAVEVYDALNGFKRLGRTRHTGIVTHLDWSSDSEFLQTDDASKQHLYFRRDCTKVADSRMCSELTFSPWTCKYGWSVQGVWEDPAQPDDVVTVRTSRDKRLCYVGDSKGNIKVFLYPSVSKLASHRMYRGHGPVVSGLALSFDESFLITTASDGCLFQWAVVASE